MERWRDLSPLIQAERCGASCRETDQGALVELEFLGRRCSIAHPGAAVRCATGEPSLWERILLLHYLTAFGPVLDDASLISFAELPDGRFYETAFKRRTAEPLLSAFAAEPQGLVRAAVELGGASIELGDAAARVPVLPRINLYLVLWAGDAELPATAVVLMERSIQSFLTAEDVAVLSGALVGRVIARR